MQSKKRSRSAPQNSPTKIDKKRKKVTVKFADTNIMIDTNENEDIDDWNLWVSATATRNYLLDDGLLDVLKHKGSTLTKLNTKYQDTIASGDRNDYVVPTDNTGDNFVTSIMQQGVKFEKKVINLIVEKLGNKNIINIGGDCNARSHAKYLNTIKAMKDGVPVIYQGIVRNYTNKTYGVCDLIVRSDWLSKLYDQKIKTKKKCYVVIDIKFKTLSLKADGIHLRNDGIMKAYKSQLCIYNDALGIMQGYKPPVAYIMGWRWKYTCRKIEYRGENCFDRLGHIDYTTCDKEYITKTKAAVKWLNLVATTSHEWDLSTLPLPHPQLYPNMCNHYDYPYYNVKKKFAEDIGEISLLWKCGPKQRKAAHAKGIYTWDDPKCTTDTLAIGGKFTSKIVDRILSANRSDSNILPIHITSNYDDWKNKKQLEFFVDFEMTCSVFTEFDDLPNADGEALIFMIGIGHIIRNENGSDEWVFKNFTLDRLTREGENQICEDMYQYIKSLQRKFGCFEPPFLYHWSHAEPSAWKRSISRYANNDGWKKLMWSDLLKVFQTEPIGIKGCLDYKLKNVAKAFYKYGYITSIWDNGSSCVDGADAAVGAYKIEKETVESGTPFNEAPLAQEIIKYNEVDCKVLQQILYWLRENHIAPDDPDIDHHVISDISDNDRDDSPVKKWLARKYAKSGTVKGGFIDIEDISSVSDISEISSVSDNEDNSVSDDMMSISDNEESVSEIMDDSDSEYFP